MEKKENNNYRDSEVIIKDIPCCKKCKDFDIGDLSPICLKTNKYINIFGVCDIYEKK